jgi:hypothetical protein
VNPSLFNSSRRSILNEVKYSADLQQKNGKERLAAETKNQKAVEAANKIRNDSLADLDEAYKEAKTLMEAQEEAAILALLVAKRASKDSKVFDAAFAVAYKFEYNRLME